MVLDLERLMVMNFFVDYLLLLSTNRLSGFPPGWGRCAMAGALGSVYGAMCLLPEFSFLGSSLWRVLFLAMMGTAAFGFSRSGTRRAGVFVLLSMAMGGIAVGAGSNRVMMLVFSAGVMWILCRLVFGAADGGREFVNVTITEGNHKVQILALKDTGNTLRDPITGEQVLILGPDSGKILTGLEPERFAAPLETMVRFPGFRLIPYRTLGTAGGMLLAKRFQNVIIGTRKGSALVAFAPERIGEGDVFQALTGGEV